MASGAAKIFDCIRFLTERGVAEESPPNKSLDPPPGGFKTLKIRGKNSKVSHYD